MSGVKKIFTMCIFSRHLIEHIVPATTHLRSSSVFEDELTKKFTQLSIEQPSLKTLNFFLIATDSMQAKADQQITKKRLSPSTYDKLLAAYGVKPLIAKPCLDRVRLEDRLSLEKIERVQDVFFQIIFGDGDTDLKDFFLRSEEQTALIWNGLNRYLEEIIPLHEELNSKEIYAIPDYCPFTEKKDIKEYNRLLNVMCQGLSRVGFSDERKLKMTNALFKQMEFEHQNLQTKKTFFKTPSYEEAKLLFLCLNNSAIAQAHLSELSSCMARIGIINPFDVATLGKNFVKLQNLRFQRDKKTEAQLPYSCSFYKTLLYYIPIAPSFLRQPFSEALTLEVEKDLSCYDRLQDISLYRLDKAHIMDTKGYLEHRFSKTSLSYLYEHKELIEFFLGPEEDLESYYKIQHNLFTSLKFRNPNSFRMSVLTNFEGETKKIVFHHMQSFSRVFHLGYQLQLADVSVSDVKIRGSFTNLYRKEREALLGFLAICKPKILFLGASLLSRDCNTADIKMIKKEKFFKHEGLTKGYFLEFTSKDKRDVPCVSFSMPFGELAYELTKTCLDAGVKTVVLLGAGGTINQAESTSPIGSYRVIRQVLDQGSLITLEEDSILFPEINESDLQVCDNEDRPHMSVRSPLEESCSWIKEAHRKRAATVDVEVSHVIRAFREKKAISSDVKIVPGVFISDIIDDPRFALKSKISPEHGLKGVAALVKWVLAQSFA